MPALRSTYPTGVGGSPAAPWTTLSEYLQYLAHRGISNNVASFVGATTVRIHVLGHEDRAPTPDELERMEDLVIEDDSRVGTAYFLMSEENIRKKIARPWVAFGSDAESLAPEGVFLKSNPHPRAYGTFARLLGKYVREEAIISLSEAIRRLTSLPAGNLGLVNRGLLKEGYFADITIFDPSTITDNATYSEPHRYATGVLHVIVNGVPVLLDGEHTGATPGRFVRKPPAGS